MLEKANFRQTRAGTTPLHRAKSLKQWSVLDKLDCKPSPDTNKSRHAVKKCVNTLRRRILALRPAITSRTRLKARLALETSKSQLKRQREKAVQAGEKLLHKDLQEKTRAARTLSRLEQKALPFVPRLVEQALKVIHEEHDPHKAALRQAATTTLQKFKPETASHAITLLRSEDPVQAEKIVRLLEQTQGNRLAFSLGLIIKHPKHRYTKVGEAAVDALARAADARNAAQVKNILLKSIGFASAEIAVKSLEILGRIGDAECAQQVVGLLKSQNNRTRRAAAEALEKLGNTHVAFELENALKKEQHMETRNAMLNAVTTLQRLKQERRKKHESSKT